jgi:K+-transporting ATPase ATPase C chain
MSALWRPILVLFALLSALTGIVYPLVVTGIGTLAFPDQVSGSLLMRGRTVVGSSLIAQSFQSPGYFWGRPSATSPGSNLGPTNPALLDAVRGRIAALKAADQVNPLPIPVDLVTASASGLDPHVSPAAAFYQVERVSRARHLDPDELRRLVQSQIEQPQWGVLGEARVNVLVLNMKLDRAK